MFIDETTITVKAGDGGNGCFAYERQKYRPKGKPSGGDGGNGGNIIAVASPNIHTLQDVSYKRSYKAERGTHGKGSNKTGKKGEEIVIKVPLGTVVTDSESGKILFDCIKAKKRYLVAKGGKGGRGNASLASRKNPNPECATPGKPGEEKKLRLTLKVLADVGLVGRPNAGKSTFLSRVSKARPKIADYPFTTTRPHLGIVPFPETYDSLVIADIPGLIEDAHEGKGMGIRFLKHIERTSILAIMVDALSEDPVGDAEVLRKELEEYSKELVKKPCVYVMTKTDLIADNDEKTIPDGWLGMSSVTGDGVGVVLRKLKDLFDELNSAEGEDSMGLLDKSGLLLP